MQRNRANALRELREARAQDSHIEKRMLRQANVLRELAGWRAEAHRPFRLKLGATRTPGPEKLPADEERSQARA